MQLLIITAPKTIESCCPSHMQGLTTLRTPEEVHAAGGSHRSELVAFRAGWLAHSASIMFLQCLVGCTALKATLQEERGKTQAITKALPMSIILRH